MLFAIHLGFHLKFYKNFIRLKVIQVLQLLRTKKTGRGEHISLPHSTPQQDYRAAGSRLHPLVFAEEAKREKVTELPGGMLYGRGTKI